jgi:hypothetical protein
LLLLKLPLGLPSSQPWCDWCDCVSRQVDLLPAQGREGFSPRLSASTWWVIPLCGMSALFHPCQPRTSQTPLQTLHLLGIELGAGSASALPLNYIPGPTAGFRSTFQGPGVGTACVCVWTHMLSEEDVMSMCVNVYMYTCIYVEHVCMLQMHVHTCMCLCTHVHMRVHARVCVYTW